MCCALKSVAWKKLKQLSDIDNLKEEIYEIKIVKIKFWTFFVDYYIELNNLTFLKFKETIMVQN